MMKNSNTSGQLIAWFLGLGLVFGATAASAQRIILKDHDYTVSRVDDSCADMIRLRVETGRPAIFREDSPEMESLITTTRAIAGFECPGLTALRLDGFHADSGEQLFEARTGDRNDWQLSVRYRADAVNSDRDADTKGNYQVAKLYIDMPLDEAHARLSEEFGRDSVRYDDWDRTLIAGNEGCPLNRSGRNRILPAGARCIQARFSDKQSPVLQSMRLLQSVSGDQMSAGISALQDRYGRPDFNERREPRKRQREAGVSDVLHLGWGETVRRGRDGQSANGQRPRRSRHQLEADISSSGNQTWLLMRLRRPDPKNEKDDSDSDSLFGF